MKPKLKIAHVSLRYSPAPLTGSELYVEALSKILAAKGHDVTVLTTTALSFEAFDKVKGLVRLTRENYMHFFEKTNGINVFRFPIHYELQWFFKVLKGINRRLFKLKHLDELLSLMLRQSLTPEIYINISSTDYDIVHATPFPYTHVYFAYRATSRKGIPFVVTPFIHYKLKEHWFNWYMLQVIKGASATIAMTKFEKKILNVLGAKRCYIASMGIWTDTWLGVKGDEVREKLGLEDSFVILVPRRMYIKGAFHTLLASTILSRQGIRTAVITVGEFTDPLYQKVKKYAEERSVRVIDFGYVSEHLKRKLFAACDVLAAPSLADAFGKVYLEAWACGKPVIAARTPVMSEIVRDGIDGFLVEFGNVIELAKKLEILAKDSELREKMGKEGREKVFKYYDWRIVGQKIERIYYELTFG